MTDHKMLDLPGRFLLRPAVPDDLVALERLAHERAIGISSLPTDRAALLDKLERSAQAFASEEEASGEEIYLFVLEDLHEGSRIIGTSGIEASPGFQDRFYNYRSEFIVQVSEELGTRNRIHTLHLCHDLTGVTLLTGFHIAPAYARSLAPQLLSRGRLIFMAQQAERFSDRVAAENPGPADEDGGCPFWDGVGRRFFDMDYPSAEALNRGQGRGSIAELLPQSPIYVPLLDEAAQWALGQLHPVGELPFAILMDEGFDTDTYVNIYDGGPTVEERLQSLKTVRRLHGRRCVDGPMQAAHGRQLVSNGRRADFRATLACHDDESQELALDAAARAALRVEPGDLVLAATLDRELA
ncbi:arginine N-succinyltransferase [Paucibacter sp. JuS9]|uniref:arginine N-succinyltransferase n=1 Tax=Paucibacter sp. JuS9 TaxID=3228748 RepID=UPI003757BD9F